jgi:endonuclease/exonuclease/phosphatase family metal-dependent hydrolase
LKLATFNIAHGRGTNESNFSPAAERFQRLKKIAEMLKEEKADIVVLQEVDFDAAWTGHEDQARVIARAAGYKYVLEHRNFDVSFPLVRFRCGNAILSNHRIVASHLVPLPVFSKWEQLVAGAKQAVCVDLQVAKDERVRLLAVHMEPRDEATRVRCSEPVLKCAAASPYPFFCLGDFNSTPTNFPGAAEADRGGLSLLQVLRESKAFQIRPEDPPVPDQLTWPSFAPSRLIDWIMVPNRWNIVDYGVRHTDLSDHRAVFAEVRRP